MLSSTPDMLKRLAAAFEISLIDKKARARYLAVQLIPLPKLYCTVKLREFPGCTTRTRRGPRRSCSRSRCALDLACARSRARECKIGFARARALIYKTVCFPVIAEVGRAREQLFQFVNHWLPRKMCQWAVRMPSSSRYSGAGSQPGDREDHGQTALTISQFLAREVRDGLSRANF